MSRDIYIIPTANSPVKGSNEDVSIWKNCISIEFPVISSEIVEGTTFYKIGEPHLGYSMVSRLEDGLLGEEAHIYDTGGNLVADLQIQDRIGNGRCRLYYGTGELYFSGYLSQGYRNGLGLEYNKNGTVVFKGFFQNGCRNFHITNRMDRREYWNERDDSGNLVSVCRKDESGENDGVCYFYWNGNIKYISRWEHGEEVEMLHNFEGEIMKSYINNKLVYFGKYLKQSDFDYIQQEDQMTTHLKNSELRVISPKGREEVRNTRCTKQRCDKITVFCVLFLVCCCVVDFPILFVKCTASNLGFFLFLMFLPMILLFIVTTLARLIREYLPS